MALEWLAAMMPQISLSAQKACLPAQQCDRSAIARCYGHIDDAERAKIHDRLALSGIGAEAEQFLMAELDAPLDFGAPVRPGRVLRRPGGCRAVRGSCASSRSAQSRGRRIAGRPRDASNGGSADASRRRCQDRLSFW